MQVITQLMFRGSAEAAMKLYCDVIPNSRVVSIERYVAGEAGEAGTVKRAIFSLAGTTYACIDSPIEHAFGFTPSFSLFVDVETREQLKAAFDRLSENGQVLMPPGAYGFSRWFTWVQDQFGVSWQLNLP